MAVKNFAREEFALKHRYAMVLHTDEPHPHVHMVVKAMGADGKRLNMRHETLRRWRRDFAQHLRAQGIAANATERAVRGVTQPRKLDAIFRAASRGTSIHWRQRATAVAQEVRSGQPQADPGKARLLDTRRAVIQGWGEIANQLALQNHTELAAAVRTFVQRLPPPRTEREWIRERMLRPDSDRGHRAAHLESVEVQHRAGREGIAAYWRELGPLRALTGAPEVRHRSPSQLAEGASRLTTPTERLRRGSDKAATRTAAELAQARQAETAHSQSPPSPPKEQRRKTPKRRQDSRTLNDRAR